MGAGTTYDAVRWHFPQGKDCPSLDAAKTHFTVAMKWLKKHKLLSDEGLEALRAGIDADFALTSHMLTTQGNRVLAGCYGKWLRTVTYGTVPSTELLDKYLTEHA